MDLQAHIERKTGVIIKDWEKIITIKDLKDAVGIKSVVKPKDGRARWVIDVGSWNPTDEEWEKALSLVPKERVDKVKRYKFKQDQKCHLVGRLFLRRLIHDQLGIAYSDIVFAYTKGNKPVLGCPVPSNCAFDNFNFNYSHEGNYVVGGCEPICIIGCDVAKVEIRGRDKKVSDYFASMDKCFSLREWNVINDAGTEEAKLLRFYVFWSLKESYVKATGWGLATEFNTFEFRDVFIKNVSLEDNLKIRVVVEGREQSLWKFRSYIVDDKHVMAVACGVPQDAAPTFKATFKMSKNNPAWQRPPSPPDSIPLTRVTVPELLKGMTPCEK